MCGKKRILWSSWQLKYQINALLTHFPTPLPLHNINYSEEALRPFVTRGTVRLVEVLMAMALLRMIIAGAAAFPPIATVDAVILALLLLMATMDHLLLTFVADQTPIFAMAAIDLEVALLRPIVADPHPLTALPRFAMDPVVLPFEAVVAAMDVVDVIGRTKVLPEFLY